VSRSGGELLVAIKKRQGLFSLCFYKSVKALKEVFAEKVL
jgi:hypothetical protein